MHKAFSTIFLIVFSLLQYIVVEAQDPDDINMDALKKNMIKAKEQIRSAHYREAKITVDYINSLSARLSGLNPQLWFSIYDLNSDVAKFNENHKSTYSYLQKALAIAQKHKFKELEVFAQIKMIDYLRIIGQIEKGKKQFRIAKKLLGDIEPPNDSLESFLYNRYASMDIENDSSILYSRKSLAISRRNGFKELEASSLNELGYRLSHHGLDTSLHYYLQAVPLWREVGHRYNLINTLNNISGILVFFNQPEKAIAYLDTTISEIGEDHYINIFCQHWQTKSAAFQSLGKLDSALHYYRLYHDCRVNRLESVQDEMIKEMEIQFQLDDKNKLIERQKADINNKRKVRNLLFLITVLTIIVLLVFIWLYFRLQSRKRKISLQKDELDVLYKEVHHRVKNNLAIIVGILEMQLNMTKIPELKTALFKASSRINSISLMHDLIHKNFSLSNISAKDYLRYLSDYLISFEAEIKNIKIRISCPENYLISMQMAVPIGIIVNELLLNSIKHAKIPHDIIECNIVLSQAEDKLILQYSDNGTESIPVNELEKNKHVGMYLINTMTRQLEGTVKMTLNKGFSAVFSFKIHK